MLDGILGQFESNIHDLAGQAHEGENVDDLVKQTINQALTHFTNSDQNTDELKAKLQSALNTGAGLIPDDKPNYKKALEYASSLLA